MGIFEDWQQEIPEIFGRVPLALRHHLHSHELFSDAGLAELIERCPRSNYTLVQWGAQASRSNWREGEIEGLSGANVIEAVRRGRMWLNMRGLHQFSPAHSRLLEEIFSELSGRLPSYRTFSQTMGLLVSSPLSRTIYHADLPGQSLWQLRGAKRIHLYPGAAPFLREDELEKIALSGVEMNLTYEAWFEKYAVTYDLEPGDMMFWPLNMPHRVDNHDVLNVSMTLEWFTPEIRRTHMVTMANAILRHKLGITPKSRDIHGAAFWTKAILQKALRNTGWIKRESRARKPATFRPDPHQPEGIIELAGTRA